MGQRNIEQFKQDVVNYYRAHKRYLPWRETITPYGVVVSEIMLQQTQVPRVLVKYPEFLTAFPSFESLSNASLEDVLRVWQGMGYNRRAKYLREIAEIIATEQEGTLPADPDVLDALPGIGPATARSIVTFVYNNPEVFIETNIRRVFIHHFFPDREKVADSEIELYVQETLDKDNPREWYYALMDYGTYLATQVENPNRRSRHYSRQSKFEGSRRQVRGGILKVLLQSGPLTKEELVEQLGFEKERVDAVLEEMEKEGFIVRKNGTYGIR